MDPITRRNALAYDTHAEEWQEAMSENVAHKYIEKPAMENELPTDLSGKIILSIGVGSGDELAEILNRNPSKVVAIDISNKLLEIARLRFPSVEFKKMEMTDLDFQNEYFDFVYSSLVFHYANDWDILLSEVSRVLKNSGELLFSTHHPDYWEQKSPTGNIHINERKVTLTEHTAILPGDVEVTYYNHPSIGSIVDAVENAGFQVKRSFSPPLIDVSLDKISPTEMDGYLKRKSENKELPIFFIVHAKKLTAQ